MKSLVELRETQLFYENGVLLGHVITDMDGFYYFWPELRGGSWSAEVLQEIATLLEEKNKPWQEQINREFRGDTGSPVLKQHPAFKTKGDLA